MALNTIICATKGSEECRTAEDKAIEIAKENNSLIIFLHAIITEGIDENDKLYFENARKTSNAILMQWQKKLKRKVYLLISY